MLHVSARHPCVPANLWQVLALYLHAIIGEADDVELISGILAVNEPIEGHRNPLGRREAAEHSHGAALVEQQHGGYLAQMLGAMYLDVFGLQAYGNVGAFPQDGVEQGAMQVYVKRVAELVLLRLSGMLASVAAIVDFVAAHAILL